MIELSASREELRQVINALLQQNQNYDETSARMLLLAEAVPELAQLLLVNEGLEPGIDQISFQMFVSVDQTYETTLPANHSGALRNMIALLHQAEITITDLRALAVRSSMASSFASARSEDVNLNGAFTAVVSLGVRYINGELVRSEDIRAITDGETK
ncbi:MAG: hypothetical protein ACFB03_09175 [Paracoccaceae bacterium]